MPGGVTIKQEGAELVVERASTPGARDQPRDCAGAAREHGQGRG